MCLIENTYRTHTVIGSNFTTHSSHARKTSTYKRRDMSLTKYLILKKRTKLVVGTFFQLSGATLEILVSLSTKKNSLSDHRIEKRTEKNVKLASILYDI